MGEMFDLRFITHTIFFEIPQCGKLVIFVNKFIICVKLLLSMQLNELGLPHVEISIF